MGAAFLALSLRDVSWAEFQDELANIAGAWLLCALALYWLELGLRIGRWRVLLSRVQPPIVARHQQVAFLSGYAANNILPAKLGEPFRADLLGRLADCSRLTAFGSIIVERLFDMVMVLLMTAWGVFFITTSQLDTLDNVNRGLAALVAPIVLLVLVVAFIVLRKDNALVAKLRELNHRVHNLLRGLHSLEEPANILRLVGATVCIWLLNCLAIWCIMQALDVQLSINQTVLLIGITGISAAIPAAPAGIGTLQYAFHITAVLLGFSTTSAIVAATIIQVVLLGSATIVGAMCYSYAVSHFLLNKGEAGR